MSETAPGKTVHQWAANPPCEIVIYQRAYVGSQCGEQHHQKHVQVAALYAAGGTTASEGKGMNELSIIISIVIVQ